MPILTWLNPSGVDAEAAATDQIDVEVGSVGELDALVKHAPSRVRVHLNMDTGMAREGCPMRERDTLIARARQGKAGEDPRRVPHRAAPVGRPGEPEANTLAVSRMRQARRAVMAAGFDAPLTHLAATSGTDGGVAWPRRPAVTPATSPTTPSAKIALPLGLVDVKVAAVDDVWYGLKIVWRVKIARNADAPTSARRASASCRIQPFPFDASASQG